MAWIHVRQQVEDYNRWKEIYDATSELKLRYGWKRYRIFNVGGSRTDLLVMEEYATVQQAQSFVQSDDFRNIAHKAGVVGTPEVLVLGGLEEGTA